MANQFALRCYGFGHDSGTNLLGSNSVLVTTLTQHRKTRDSSQGSDRKRSFRFVDLVMTLTSNPCILKSGTK